jgi:hypothetical protein
LNGYGRLYTVKRSKGEGEEVGESEEDKEDKEE